MVRRVPIDPESAGTALRDRWSLAPVLKTEVHAPGLVIDGIFRRARDRLLIPLRRPVSHPAPPDPPRFLGGP